MTKDEIKEEIRRAGVSFRTGLNKDELMDILNKIHVHRSPTQDPVPDPGPGPANPPDPNAPPVDQPDPNDPPDPNAPPVDEFDELYKKIGGAQAPNLPPPVDKPLFETKKKKFKKGESSSDSFRIEGYLLLLVVDMIFPFAFSFINNMLDKKIKVEANDLKLSESDWKKLEPLADQAADYIAVNISPVAGFFLMSSFMYGNNLLAVRMGVSMNKAT